MRVFLAGNPNAGKTTLFNALTGASGQTGNYGGVTVAARQAPLRQAGQVQPAVLIVDLPGCYSLTPRAKDEAITQQALLGPDFAADDLVVCVVDGAQLARGLYLALQLREMGLSPWIVLSRMDLASKRGVVIDAPQLATRLALFVYHCSAWEGAGVASLGEALMRRAQASNNDASVARAPQFPPTRLPHAYEQLPTLARQALAPLVQALQDAPVHAPDREGLALWLVSLGVRDQTPPLPQTVLEQLRQVRGAMAEHLGTESSPGRWAIAARFREIDALVAAVVRQPLAAMAQGHGLDNLLLHPLWGSIALLIALFALFQLTFWASQPLIDAIEMGIGLLGAALTQILPPSLLQSLLVDGALAGIGNVLTFVPQIGLLFFGLSLLEQSGYMARAALLLDWAMRRVHLSGRAFIPLMSSLGCAIPGIMATRTLEDPRDRLRTMLVAPMMSCSARLPTYTLVIGAVFSHFAPLGGVLNVGGLVLLALYALGFAAALGTAALLAWGERGRRRPVLLLELPDYRWPNVRLTARDVTGRLGQFVQGSGGTILALSLVVWATLAFPRLHADPDDARPPSRSAQLEHSLAGRVGHLLEPAMRPLGFDWHINVGLLAAFAAREVLVSTLAQTYALEAPSREEGEGPRMLALREALLAERDDAGAPRFTALTGVSLMVFFALALQCSSTVAVLRRETGGWRWPLAALAYMNGLAYACSLAVYQLGRLWGFA